MSERLSVVGSLNSPQLAPCEQFRVLVPIPPRLMHCPQLNLRKDHVSARMLPADLENTARVATTVPADRIVHAESSRSSLMSVCCWS